MVLDAVLAVAVRPLGSWHLPAHFMHAVPKGRATFSLLCNVHYALLIQKQHAEDCRCKWQPGRQVT